MIAAGGIRSVSLLGVNLAPTNAILSAQKTHLEHMKTHLEHMLARPRCLGGDLVTRMRTRLFFKKLFREISNILEAKQCDGSRTSSASDAGIGGAPSSVPLLSGAADCCSPPAATDVDSIGSFGDDTSSGMDSGADSGADTIVGDGEVSSSSPLSSATSESGAVSPPLAADVNDAIIGDSEITASSPPRGGVSSTAPGPTLSSTKPTRKERDITTKADNKATTKAAKRRAKRMETAVSAFAQRAALNLLPWKLLFNCGSAVDESVVQHKKSQVLPSLIEALSVFGKGGPMATAPSAAAMKSAFDVWRVFLIERHKDIAPAANWRAVSKKLDGQAHVRCYGLKRGKLWRVCVLVDVRARTIYVYSVFVQSEHKSNDKRYVPDVALVEDVVHARKATSLWREREQCYQ